MNLVVRAMLLAAWLLGIGLIAVCLESERIRIGHRIHYQLGQREKLIERVRRLEIRYNELVSPDLLEKRVPDSFLPAGRFMADAQRHARS
jgi:hypothetical protein